MTFSLSAASRAKFKNVHPALVRVVERAILLTPVDFRVTCGARSIVEQRRLMAAGATRTMKSRHIPTTNASGMSEAIDVACVIDGKVRWDWPLYSRVAEAMKEAARREKVAIEWGGDWKTFKDGPHFQLRAPAPKL